MNRDRIGVACLAAVLVGAGFQFFLFRRGFYSIGWDESGRTLDAYNWAFHGIVQVKDWLPFYRVVVGSALKILPDLILTPRIVSNLFGLATIPAIAWVTHELFQDRRSTLVALAGGTLFSQRVALSLAPLSSLMFGLFVLAGMALFARWLRTDNWAALYAGAMMIAIAETVRYEGWIFAGAFLGITAIRSLRQPKRLLMAGLILASVPAVLFALQAFTQAETIGFSVAQVRQESTLEILRWNPLVQFVWRNAVSLNLVGVILLVHLLRREDSRYRFFVAAAFGPLFVVSLGLLMVHGSQTAPAWRMIAVWSMLLLPFTAHSLGGPWRWSRNGRKVVLGAAAVLLAVFVYDLRGIRNESRWAFPEFDRLAGTYVQRLLDRQPAAKVLVESSEFFYLNVVLASQHPEAFVLNDGPARLGAPKPLLERGRSVRFALENKGISLLIFRTPEYTAYLDSSPEVMKVRQYGPWSLYASSLSVR